MPCNGNYMNPSEHESQSKFMCQMIIYIADKTGCDVDGEIIEAANNYYGNTAILDHATATSDIRTLTLHRRPNVPFGS